MVVPGWASWLDEIGSGMLDELDAATELDEAGAEEVEAEDEAEAEAEDETEESILDDEAEREEAEEPDERLAAELTDPEEFVAELVETAWDEEARVPWLDDAGSTGVASSSLHAANERSRKTRVLVSASHEMPGRFIGRVPPGAWFLCVPARMIAAGGEKNNPPKRGILRSGLPAETYQGTLAQVPLMLTRVPLLSAPALSAAVVPLVSSKR